MLDLPDRKPAAAKLIACPPRRQHQPADPCAMVIFGATGDLTKRLVVPALYNLMRTKVLPDHFALFGVARSDESSESWRDQLYGMLKSFVGRAGAEFNADSIDEGVWKQLAAKITYVQGDLSKPELYQDLRTVLSDSEKAHSTGGNVIFYLAVADHFFGTVVEQ
jgi:glucose-6-phosphate 1-dehydrogenase